MPARRRSLHRRANAEDLGPSLRTPASRDVLSNLSQPVAALPVAACRSPALAPGRCPRALPPGVA
jgi:hypothetical protein